MQDCFPKDIYEEIYTSLIPIYEIGESQSMTFEVLEELFDVSRTDLIINTPIQISTETRSKLDGIINRLQGHEPIQYVFKKAHFYGREFYVDQSVLIPRQETESLIELIVKWQNWNNPKILDIGTGSGSIANTLALELTSSEVYGIDVSEEALQVATKNSDTLKAQVTFEKTDILRDDIGFDQMDIVVSNPPYVRELEMSHMNPNVLDNEPHLALFVPDDDPLLFYNMIAHKSRSILNHDGMLFFEINEVFGDDIVELLKTHQYEDPAIYQDLNGKDRFAAAKWCG